MSQLRHPRIVAWRSIEELADLRDDFFPSPGKADRRAMAVSKVRAWTIRSRIPHSIESTSILTEAVLHDTIAASHLSLRLSYSAAICRFVNGLLDPAQQSQFALPMTQLAQDLGLPASFVEIRHAATHEELPSLCVLRAVAVRALQWLWSNYWVTVGAELEGTNSAEETWLVTRAQRLLGRWRKLRRDNPLKEFKQGDMTQDARDTRTLVNECVDICRNGDGLQAFLVAMLEEKALIPAGKKKANLMHGAFTLWTPLLKAIDRSVDGFLEQLLLAILELFKTSVESPVTRLKVTTAAPLLATSVPEEALDAMNTEFIDAVHAWFYHLSSRKFFGADGATIDFEMLAKQCILNPGERNIDSLRHILTNYPLLADKYRFLLDVAVFQIEGDVKVGQKRTLQDIDDEVSGYEKSLQAILRYSDQPQNAIGRSGKAGKWRRLEGPWVARPLGVV